MDKNFWKTKKLSEFSEEEWEAVCMRCGKCCLFKNVDKGKMHFLNHICENFDLKTCSCSCYATRLSPDCSKVNLKLLQNERELLPETCAYRLLYEGKELPDYHPLISGDKNSVHKAKQTVQEFSGKIYSYREITNFLDKHFAHIFEHNWEKANPDEFAKKLQEFSPVAVEIYPIPTN